MSQPVQVLRFIIDVDEDWQVMVRDKDETRLSTDLPPRKMLKSDDGAGAKFPQPPQSELPEETDLHYKLCRDDDEAKTKFGELYLGRIQQRRTNPDDTVIFGRYLFDTLLGQEVWNQIQTQAKVVDPDKKMVIELALRWPVTETDLHRLNWEMMCRPAAVLRTRTHPNQYGFLADGFPRRIAITRLVAGVEHSAREIQAPPRLLSVVGCSASDSRIRLGMDIMGVLERPEVRIRLRQEVLLAASPSTLKDKIKQFRPDIVHFICHGGIDPGNQVPFLEMQPDTPGATSRFAADALCAMLSLDGTYPPIVILNACFSAAAGGGTGTESAGVHQVGPLAAALVAAGVPVVVGMAGSISDLACQLFVRAFGGALVEGRPVIAAATEGRAVAVYEGTSAHQSVDWALPAVFLSPKVQADYVPCPVDATQPCDPATVLGERATRYANDPGPVFCDRYPFFDKHEALLNHEGGVSILAIYSRSGSPKKLGKSRLLKELAAQGLRDGYIPCLVNDKTRTITDVTAFGLAVLRAIELARDAFRLPKPVDSALLKHLALTLTSPQRLQMQSLRESWAGDYANLYPGLLDLCEQAPAPLNVKQVRAALAADLKALAKEACQPGPGKVCPAKEREAGKPTVVVLLDDVDEYDAKVIQALCSGELADADGLGESGFPVPVVIAFAGSGPGGPQLEGWCGSPPAHLQPMELSRFARSQSDDVEDLLAAEEMQVLQRVLLHPYRKNPKPGLEDRPLALDLVRKKPEIKQWLEDIQPILNEDPRWAYYEGYPWALASGAKTKNALVPGKTQQELDDLMNRMKKGNPPHD